MDGQFVNFGAEARPVLHQLDGGVRDRLGPFVAAKGQRVVLQLQVTDAVAQQHLHAAHIYELAGLFVARGKNSRQSQNGDQPRDDPGELSGRPRPRELFQPKSSYGAHFHCG